MRSILLLLGCLLLFGCAAPEETPEPNVTPQPPEEPEMTCEEYCPTLPHIECVGEWEILGTYPDCTCNFVCEVTEEEPEEEPEEEVPPEEPPPEPPSVASTDKSINELLDDGIDKVKSDFYMVASGRFEEKTSKWRSLPVDAPAGEISFDVNSPYDMKFAGEKIDEVQASGFVLFEDVSSENVEIYGLAIFNAFTTKLDDYSIDGTFDVEYINPHIAKDLKDCWIYEKSYQKDINDEWLVTYFFQCMDIEDR